MGELLVAIEQARIDVRLSKDASIYADSLVRSLSTSAPLQSCQLRETSRHLWCIHRQRRQQLRETRRQEHLAAKQGRRRIKKRGGRHKPGEAPGMGRRRASTGAWEEIIFSTLDVGCRGGFTAVAAMTM